MTDRPIIFSGPMVEALLAGRKTQTRRLASSPLAKVAPGDRLWVRECVARYQTVNMRRRADGGAFDEISDGLAGYRADGHDTIEDFKQHVRLMSGTDLVGVEVLGDKWIPSIHMPRWASRLTLIVTDVRQQRLQEISEEDCQAEGVDRDTESCDHKRASCDEIGCLGPTHKASFCELWASLHGWVGPAGWRTNPDIVAISFRVERANIDAVSDSIPQEDQPAGV